ncbi:MAG: shikimate kinase [Vicinamibacteria bacterium]
MEPGDFLLHLGRQLRERRVLQGLSQEQLAQRAGLSPRYISQIEAGRGNLSILRLLGLTRALGIPIHEAVHLDKWHPIVALIGLRGAGKSTVGRELARRLNRRFAELDALIEENAGLGIAEIFALHGESFYRRLEQEALARFVSDHTTAVLATGGGIVTDRATYDLLKRSAVTVWLRARPELHLQRVSAQGDRRPMAERADPLADLKTLLRDRERLYAEADITIDTSDLLPERVAETLIRRIEPSRVVR